MHRWNPRIVSNGMISLEMTPLPEKRKLLLNLNLNLNTLLLFLFLLRLSPIPRLLVDPLPLLAESVQTVQLAWPVWPV